MFVTPTAVFPLPASAAFAGKSYNREGRKEGPQRSRRTSIYLGRLLSSPVVKVCGIRGYLLSPLVLRIPPIDGASGFVIICAYTGKEVV
jgi:hypothetical protein